MGAAESSCPGCNVPLPEGAAICPHCGVDLSSLDTLASGAGPILGSRESSALSVRELKDDLLDWLARTWRSVSRAAGPLAAAGKLTSRHPAWVWRGVVMVLMALILIQGLRTTRVSESTAGTAGHTPADSRDPQRTALLPDHVKERTPSEPSTRIPENEPHRATRPIASRSSEPRSVRGTEDATREPTLPEPQQAEPAFPGPASGGAGIPAELTAAPSDPFGLAEPEVELTGIFGTVCDPLTGQAAEGMIVVVRDGAGREYESPPSMPGGGFSMPVQAGARYEPVALISADGTRRPMGTVGLGIRIWPGRHVELNLCHQGAGGSAETILAEQRAASLETTDPVVDPAPPAGLTGFYGTVFDPMSGEPASGFRVVIKDDRGRQFVGQPSTSRGEYTLSVAAGRRYTPVAVIAADGLRYQVVDLGSGIRVVAGRAVLFNFRQYE